MSFAGEHFSLVFNGIRSLYVRHRSGDMNREKSEAKAKRHVRLRHFSLFE